MYHQLKLREEDQPFHRFLWRDLDTRNKPEIYEFLRFVFGSCYCPFCVQYVWQSHRERHKNECPVEAEAVKKNCYMDDLMPSVKDVGTAKRMRKKLTSLDKNGYLIYRKYLKTYTKVIDPWRLTYKRTNCQQRKHWEFYGQRKRLMSNTSAK